MCRLPLISPRQNCHHPTNTTANHLEFSYRALAKNKITRSLLMDLDPGGREGGGLTRLIELKTNSTQTLLLGA